MPGPTAPRPTALFCENETNTARLYGIAPRHAYPKDGINDHVVSGHDTVNPDGGHQGLAAGTELGGRSRAQTVELRLRLRPAGSQAPQGRRAALGADFERGGGRSAGPRPTSSTPR